MNEYSDDEQAALKYLNCALQALDRTEHAQVAAITSHALEMLRSCSGVGTVLVAVAGCK